MINSGQLPQWGWPGVDARLIIKRDEDHRGSLLALIPAAAAQMAMEHPAQPANVDTPERLGTVLSFSVSCAAGVQARSIAAGAAARLLYEEAAAAVRGDREATLGARWRTGARR